VRPFPFLSVDGFALQAQAASGLLKTEGRLAMRWKRLLLRPIQHQRDGHLVTGGHLLYPAHGARCEALPPFQEIVQPLNPPSGD